MITVEKALKRILESITPLGVEKATLFDALNRIIGEDIMASRDIPPQDNSAMDGYAVKAEDTKGASADKPVTLTVIENIRSGYPPRKTLAPGEASKIMTGAFVPECANAIVRLEDTHQKGNKVEILAEAEKGLNVRYRGEDVRKGERVIFNGDIIRPAEMGMLASVGRSSVLVYQRPIVAILATGDELVDIDGDISGDKIISSNSYSLAGQVMACGAVPLLLGIANDTKDDLRAKFEATLRADIIISSAGISVGDFDFVKDVMEEMGAVIEFREVAQRPGKPFTFGLLHGKLFFGLPGNPVSSMISFEQYVRPAMLKMMGHKRLFRRTIRAELMEDIQQKKGFTYFIRGRVQWDGDKITVATTGEQGSGILKSMVMANGIIIIPEDSPTIKKGSPVTVQLIDNSFELTEEPGYLEHIRAKQQI
jgi:molybdopterin molybdotransferase